MVGTHWVPPGIQGVRLVASQKIPRVIHTDAAELGLGRHIRRAQDAGFPWGRALAGRASDALWPHLRETEALYRP